MADRDGDVASMVPGHYGGAATGVVMGEAAIGAAWNVQGDALGGTLAADVVRLFGVALPLVPNTTARSDALVVFWIGPRSWLLVDGAIAGTPAPRAGFDATRDVLNAGGSALFDVGASRLAYTLRGPQVAAVLARGCPLDFHPRTFAPGHCAQSVFGHANVLIYRHHASDAFTVMVARSLARDVWRGLCLAATADGYQVVPRAAFRAD